jgi:hypothetical protein
MFESVVGKNKNILLHLFGKQETHNSKKETIFLSKNLITIRMKHLISY